MFDGELRKLREKQTNVYEGFHTISRFYDNFSKHLQRVFPDTLAKLRKDNFGRIQKPDNGLNTMRPLASNCVV